MIKPPAPAWPRPSVGLMTDYMSPKVPIVRKEQTEKRPAPPAAVRKSKPKRQKKTENKTDHVGHKTAMFPNEQAEFLLPAPRPPKDTYVADRQAKRKEAVIDYAEHDEQEARKHVQKALKELECLRRQTPEFLASINKLQRDYNEHQVAKAEVKIRLLRLEDVLKAHYEREPVGEKYKLEYYIRDRLLHFQNTNDEGNIRIHGVHPSRTRTPAPTWLQNFFASDSDWSIVHSQNTIEVVRKKEEPL
jgi:hypothetical protein